MTADEVYAHYRVDETYTRLAGKWTYIYRAIDEDGQVVDAYFSQRRNAPAAQAFFQRVIDETGVKPERVTTDRAKCYPPALRAILPDAEHPYVEVPEQRPGGRPRASE